MPRTGDRDSNLSNLLSSEKLDDLSYLLCFVKECLRFMTPGYSTISYLNKDEISFANGIVIPKGMELYVNLP